MYPPNTHAYHDQTLYFGGYDNNIGNWDGYPFYVNANNFEVVPPVIYDENPSLVFHSGYGFNSQMAYEQFSPIASHLSPVMVEGQLIPPHQIPLSPSYYPRPLSPSVLHVNSALPTSQTELIAAGSGSQDIFGDNMLLGPGSGYFLPFGSFGGGVLSGNSYSPGYYGFPGDFGSVDWLPSQSNPSEMGSYMSPLTSAAIYPQSIGILGPYEQNIGQISQHQRPFQGLELDSTSSSRYVSRGSSYQRSNYGNTSMSHWVENQRNRLIPGKGGRQDRNLDSINISSDVVSGEHNRGPRASKPKGKSNAEERSFSISKNGASKSHFGVFNHPDFVTSYSNAKFFVIKSFSEDNIHRSIKYHVWASTPLGNKKLDAAYHEAKEIKGHCPVFLLFSVNASGQFCGVAEMVGHVDFENDAHYWQQDRWSGQFPVKWHIVKDVPNSRFRHIVLENNENKPVTHSRDCQEVKLEKGIEMLKIFKEHDADASILDDFIFYDEREKVLLDNKAGYQASVRKKNSVALADAPINQLSDNFTKTLQFEDGNPK